MELKFIVLIHYFYSHNWESSGKKKIKEKKVRVRRYENKCLIKKKRRNSEHRKQQKTEEFFFFFHEDILM